MKLATFAIALVLLLGSAAVYAGGDHAHDHGQDKTGTEAPATQPAAEPVNKMCAVEQEHEANPKVTHTYQEKVYAFCCKDCIETFKKNPEKYKNAK